jgi:hypothetical protein
MNREDAKARKQGSVKGNAVSVHPFSVAFKRPRAFASSCLRGKSVAVKNLFF